VENTAFFFAALSFGPIYAILAQMERVPSVDEARSICLRSTFRRAELRSVSLDTKNNVKKYLVFCAMRQPILATEVPLAP
jgi:hypothetical protein